MHLCYNINSAEKKQATRSGICFFKLFNEHAVCEADNEHEVRACEHVGRRKKQATRSGICFFKLFNEHAVCEADNEHEVRACEHASMSGAEKTSDATSYNITSKGGFYHGAANFYE